MSFYLSPNFLHFNQPFSLSLNLPPYYLPFSLSHTFHPFTYLPFFFSLYFLPPISIPSFPIPHNSVLNAPTFLLFSFLIFYSPLFSPFYLSFFLDLPSFHSFSMISPALQFFSIFILKFTSYSPPRMSQ